MRKTTRATLIVVSFLAFAFACSSSKSDDKKTPDSKSSSNAKKGPTKVDEAFLAEVAKTELEADKFMSKHKDEEITYDGTVNREAFKNTNTGDYSVYAAQPGAGELDVAIVCNVGQGMPAFKIGDNVTMTGKVELANHSLFLAYGCKVTPR